jgi:hypothetical protein
MRFILHIGQSKTGTTSLQGVLAANRIRLAKQGILYPDIQLNGIELNIPNHNSFADSLADSIRYPGLQAEEYMSRFRGQAIAARCDTILLSAESFFGGAPQPWGLPEGADYHALYTQKLTRLKNCLAGDECRIVAYLRQQGEWLESAVGQIIRYEGLLGKSVYQDDNQLAELLHSRLDYKTLLDHWENIIQPASITVVPFDRATLRNGTTVDDFFHRLGILSEGLSIPPSSLDDHASLSREFIWLKSVLNRIPKSKVRERVLISTLGDLDRKYGSRKKYKISSELKNLLSKRYEESNQYLAARYGSDGTDFFTSPILNNSDEMPLSRSEAIKALEIFEKEWALPATMMREMKTATAGFLRKFPRIHALVRRAVLLFRQVVWDKLAA